MDPISDKFPHVSTYNYAENRVPNGIDLHGLQFVPMHDLNLNSGMSSQEKAEFRKGAMRASKGAGNIAKEIGVGMVPYAGQAIDVYDFGEAVGKGDGVGMALAGIGFIPGVGDFIKGIGKGLRNLFKSGDDAVGVLENSIDVKRTGHIFRDAEGHLPDTPENRSMLESTANSKENVLGKDKYGNEWHGKTGKDGKQVWTQSRDGKIINGGVNDKPRTYNSETGLSNNK